MVVNTQYKQIEDIISNMRTMTRYITEESQFGVYFMDNLKFVLEHGDIHQVTNMLEILSYYLTYSSLDHDDLTILGAYAFVFRYNKICFLTSIGMLGFSKASNTIVGADVDLYQFVVKYDLLEYVVANTCNEVESMLLNRNQQGFMCLAKLAGKLQ